MWTKDAFLQKALESPKEKLSDVTVTGFTVHHDRFGGHMLVPCEDGAVIVPVAYDEGSYRLDIEAGLGIGKFQHHIVLTPEDVSDRAEEIIAECREIIAEFEKVVVKPKPRAG